MIRWEEQISTNHVWTWRRGNKLLSSHVAHCQKELLMPVYSCNFFKINFYALFSTTNSPRKLTCLLKMDGWKTTFLWNGPFLGAHVSFRGVNFFKSVTPWWMLVVAFGWNGAGDLSVVSHMPGTMSIQWVYPRPTNTNMTKLMNLLVSYICSFFVRVTLPLVGLRIVYLQEAGKDPGVWRRKNI